MAPVASATPGFCLTDWSYSALALHAARSATVRDRRLSPPPAHRGSSAIFTPRRQRLRDCRLPNMTPATSGGASPAGPAPSAQPASTARRNPAARAGRLIDDSRPPPVFNLSDNLHTYRSFRVMLFHRPSRRPLRGRRDPPGANGWYWRYIGIRADLAPRWGTFLSSLATPAPMPWCNADHCTPYPIRSAALSLYSRPEQRLFADKKVLVTDYLDAPGLHCRRRRVA